MEKRTLHRRTINGELAWLPTSDPRPGQRMTVTRFNGIDFVTLDIWYHPDDWTPVTPDPT